MVSQKKLQRLLFTKHLQNYQLKQNLLEDSFMAKKKEDKKLTKDQAEKKIQTLKKDLFNIRFKKINNQIENSAQYNEIKKNIARLYTTIKNTK
jgi:large subunit ribosomal protein L29